MVPYDSDRRYVGRELAGRRQDEEGEDDRDDCSLCSDAFDNRRVGCSTLKVSPHRNITSDSVS